MKLLITEGREKAARPFFIICDYTITEPKRLYSIVLVLDQFPLRESIISHLKGKEFWFLYLQKCFICFYKYKLENSLSYSDNLSRKTEKHVIFFSV